ncbi:MAG: Ribulose-5-phosphate 4-epimerase and related epimerases and aldolases [uncultured Nocardioidaceae bacterium]|uniref:Ribulose-5-phosphate 4-epimerase and related epimerases and aldolases n=1 Tax=uncultured Nocardioidaceae bacterium TaxID=253824 RepID=A0A6J4N7D1_9ACTN|nr:MAG: Ribulose-5-phosphate 4-epimerase and related epimerases and aldolases [uncultured Nocardioidaceae bacterium]
MSPVNDPALATAREAVVAACRRAAAERLVVGTAGNISVLVGELVAITATGAVFGELDLDEVVVVDRDGQVVEGDLEPTSELDLHLGLYSDTDAQAVVHTHAPVSTAMSTVLTELPCIHYQQLLLGGAVRVAPYATFGTAELAAHVRAALDGRSAALMASHGSVAVGGTVEKALDNALLLEWLCTLYRDASVVGTPAVLDEAQQEAVVLAAIERKYGTTRPVDRPTPQENP